MFYTVDIDTRKVESKNSQEEMLAAYILDNKLQNAVILVSSEDDLTFMLNLNGLQELHGNLENLDEFFDGKPKEFGSEEACAESCWALLEEWQDEIPMFNKTLGKKLLATANKRNKESAESQPCGAETNLTKPTTKVKKLPTKRVTLDRDEVLVVVNGKSKAGSILNTIAVAIEEEMCETVGDVLDYIISNHIIPKTGELADLKFAEHNIKYFIKQGKIGVDII